MGALFLSAALLAASGCDDPSTTADLYSAIPAPTNELGNPNDVYHAPDSPAGDVVAPSVAFSLPATSNSLTVGILAFVAVDDTGVMGYALTTSAARPTADSASWAAAPATTYTFPGAGAHSLVAWAKDAAGNVSEGALDSVLITDTTAPVVTVFTLAAPTAPSKVVGVSLAITDDFGVTAYVVKDGPADPVPADWVSTKPATYTAAASGPLTLYAWAKDAAGNVSPSKSAAVIVP